MKNHGEAAMKTVEIHEWIKRGQDILDRATQTIEQAPSDPVRALLSRVPKSVVPTNDAIRVVFAGQYSAGKSSILTAMTGRDDIAIGADITTQEAHEYDWNGIKIIDTPGIHTQVRPDHDAVTYEAISSADLLVFVTTNELFDSHVASHFRKLAIDQDKAHEMLLVVNKMRRCAAGNTPAAQEVIQEDLRNVLAPFTPEQLRTSYIDAEAVIAAAGESDEKIAQILIKKSGFAAFIEEFNGFVRDRGLGSKYTTTLYTLQQILQEAIGTESTGDVDIDCIKKILLQKRRALVETQSQIPRSVANQVHTVTSAIRREGNEVADIIHGNADPKDVNKKMAQAQTRVQERTDELVHRVQITVEEQFAHLAERVAQITESQLAKELLPRLVARLEVDLAGLEVDPANLAKARQVSDATQQLGHFLVKNSFNPSATTLGGFFKLNQYSGTATHDAVKAVGHFFDKSFVPWEAVKWTRNIARAGQALAVVGTVVSFVLQIKEDVDAAKLDADLRESRAGLRAGFNEAAHAIEMHFDKTTGQYVQETIGQELEAIDQQLAELRQLQESHSALSLDLYGLLEETQALIQDMHTNSAF